MSEEEKKKALTAKIYEWHNDHFLKLMADYKIPEHDWIRKLFSSWNTRFGHAIRRFGVLTTLRMKLPLRKMKYSTVAFRITSGDENIIYAYAYLIRKRDTIRTSDWKNNFFRGHTWDYQYFVTGPSLKSQDGEYRQGFVSSLSLFHAMEQNTKLFDEIQSWVIDKIKRKDWIISNDIFPTSEDEDDLDKINAQLLKDRIALNLFTMTWTAEQYYNLINMQHNNINPRYNSILFDHDDRSYFLRLIAEYDMTELRNIKRFARRIYWEPEITKSTYKAGQKLTTLDDIHLKEIFNIKHGPWRELYVAKQVGDVVVNMISPSFMLTSGWFFIQGARPELMDNPDIWKHTNSMGVVLVTVNEYVEHTIYDSPRMLMSSQYTDRVGNFRTDPHYFAKYMFEIIYALYCMNKHCQVIHSDLHLNNATIYNYIFMDEYIKRFLPDNSIPVNIYDVDGTSFIFRHSGAFSCIIDFSRALIHPQIIKKDFPPNVVDEFHQLQKKQIITLYYELFPEFMKLNAQKFKIAVEHNFDKVFKLIMAIDPFIFCSKLKIHMSSFKDTHKDNIKLLDNIINTSRSYLEYDLNRIINFKDTELGINPNLDILKKHFMTYVVRSTPGAYFPPKNNLVLCTVFKSDREMKYSANSYETFPPPAKESKAVVDGKVIHVSKERDERYKCILGKMEKEQLDVLKEIHSKVE